MERVKVVSARHGASLAFGRALRFEESEVILAYPKAAEFHRATVNGSSGKALIEKVLLEYFGRPIKLTIQEGSAAEGTPLSLAEEEAQTRQTREKDAEARIRSHPAVESALRVLGGELEYVQVLDGPSPSPAGLDLLDEGG